MTVSEADSLARRVVIVAPTGKDAALTASVLGEASLACVVCPAVACIEQAMAEAQAP